MKKILFILSLFLALIIAENNSFAGSYRVPASITLNGGVACVASGEVTIRVFVPVDNFNEVVCANGSTDDMAVTIRIFETATLTNTGGTEVVSSTNITYTGNAGTWVTTAGLNVVVPSGSCNFEKFFYATISWNAIGCVAAGSRTSLPTRVVGNCDCTTIQPAASEQTINACGGTILDHNGISAYGTSRDDRVIICPDRIGSAIMLNLVMVDLQLQTSGSPATRDCEDFLRVWQGTQAGFFTGNPTVSDDWFCTKGSGTTIVSGATDGCLSIRMTSLDGNANSKIGFAGLISCYQPCAYPISGIVQQGNDVIICPADADEPGILSPVGDALLVMGSNTVTFGGANSSAADQIAHATNVVALADVDHYSLNNPNPAYTIGMYEWDFGDDNGVVRTTDGTINYTYTDPGIYFATLRAYDNNYSLNPDGCPSLNAVRRKVIVVPPPDMVVAPNPKDFQLICPAEYVAGETVETTVELVVDARTNLVSEPQPSYNVEPTALPDGTGVSFTNSVDLNGFFNDGFFVGPGNTGGVTCFPRICLNIEHSWASDLFIDLVAPNGQSVRMYNRNRPNGNYWMFGNCVNQADNGVQGCGAQYCIVNSGGHWNFNNNTNTPGFAAGAAGAGPCDGFTGPCEVNANGHYFRPSLDDGTRDYNSITSFANLNGTLLNGTWSIRVTDNQGLDDGWLFDWSITFPDACLKKVGEISPLVSSVAWSEVGTLDDVTTTTFTTDTDVACPPPMDAADCDGTIWVSTNEIGPFTESGDHEIVSVVTDEFGCTYSDTFNIEVICPLPVRLVSFDVINQTKHVDLTWEVGMEKDNDYYMVYRSRDGENFESVGKLNSKVGGNSSVSVFYDIQDLKPLLGLSYYMLTQTDKNGKETRLEIKSVYRSEIFGNLSIRPNPVINKAEMIFNSTINGTGQIQVLDVSGKVIYSDKLIFSKGVNFYTFDIVNFSSGVYIVEMINEINIEKIKFVKN
jgi:subtilisin-like proprotein convertase family protein